MYILVKLIAVKICVKYIAILETGIKVTSICVLASFLRHRVYRKQTECGVGYMRGVTIAYICTAYL